MTLKAAGRYDVLDEEILSHLQRVGPSSFTALNAGALGQLAEELTAPNSRGEREAFRLLDRRLQALRKAGRIKTEKQKWAVAEATAARS
jgi:hypothetical protein